MVGRSAPRHAHPRRLDHVTVVRAPAYAGAGVVGVRAGHDDRVRVPLVTLARPWRQGRAATRSEQTIPGA
jgi:hypothetical protein